MNLKTVLVSLGLILALGIGAAAAQEATPSLEQTGATAVLQDAKGNNVGQVTFSSQNDGKVVVVAKVTGLTPGFLGFHIQSVGQCDPSGSAPFASAGDILNPSSANQPNQAGDLPVLLVNADGTGQLAVVTDRFKFADLFDTDGSAVVIDSAPDNYGNVPTRYGQADSDTLKSGDSGAHTACGVIQQDQGVTAG